MKQTSKANEANTPRRTQIDVSVQQRIGEELRSMYDSITREPVPEKILKLLDELEMKGRAGDE